jgi:hypothetical protein
MARREREASSAPFGKARRQALTTRTHLVGGGPPQPRAEGAHAKPRHEHYEQFEAFVADAEFLDGPLGQDPPGVFLLVQRDVGPSAPATITENFTTGAFALVCLDYHPNLDILPDYAPFAVVGPIVVR